MSRYASAINGFNDSKMTADEMADFFEQTMDALSPQNKMQMVNMLRSLWFCAITEQNLNELYSVADPIKSKKVTLQPVPAVPIVGVINAPLYVTEQRVEFDKQWTVSVKGTAAQCDPGTFAIIHQPWMSWRQVVTKHEWPLQSVVFLPGADQGNGPTLCQFLPIGQAAQFTDVTQSWLAPYGIPSFMLPPAVENSTVYTASNAIYATSAACSAEGAPYGWTHGTPVPGITATPPQSTFAATGAGCSIAALYDQGKIATGATGANGGNIAMTGCLGYNFGPYNSVASQWSTANGYLWNPGSVTPFISAAQVSSAAATYQNILINASPKYQLIPGETLDTVYISGRVLGCYANFSVTPNAAGTQGNGKIQIALISQAIQPSFPTSVLKQQGGKNFVSTTLIEQASKTADGVVAGGACYVLGTNVLQQLLPLSVQLDGGEGNAGSFLSAFPDGQLTIGAHGCCNSSLAIAGADAFGGLSNYAIGGPTTTYPYGPAYNCCNRYSQENGGEGTLTGITDGATTGVGVNQFVYLALNGANGTNIENTVPAAAFFGGATVPIYAATFGASGPVGTPTNTNIGLIQGASGPSGGPASELLPLAVTFGPKYLEKNYSHRITGWNWTGFIGGVEQTGANRDLYSATPFAKNMVTDNFGGAYSEAVYFAWGTSSTATYARMKPASTSNALVGNYTGNLYAHTPFSKNSVDVGTVITNIAIPQPPDGLPPSFDLTWSIGPGATRACSLGQGFHQYFQVDEYGNIQQTYVPFALGRWPGSATMSVFGNGQPRTQDIASTGFDIIPYAQTQVGLMPHPDLTNLTHGVGGDIVPGGFFEQFRTRIRAPRFVGSAPQYGNSRPQYMGTYMFFCGMTDAQMSVNADIFYPRYYDVGVQDPAYVSYISGLTPGQQFSASFAQVYQVTANAATAGLGLTKPSSFSQPPLVNESFSRLVQALFAAPQSTFFKCVKTLQEMRKTCAVLFESDDIIQIFRDLVAGDPSVQDSSSLVANIAHQVVEPGRRGMMSGPPPKDNKAAIEAATAAGDMVDQLQDHVAGKFQSQENQLSDIAADVRALTQALQQLRAKQAEQEGYVKGMQSSGMMANGMMANGGMMADGGMMAEGGMMAGGRAMNAGGWFGDVLSGISSGVKTVADTAAHVANVAAPFVPLALAAAAEGDITGSDSDEEMEAGGVAFNPDTNQYEPTLKFSPNGNGEYRTAGAPFHPWKRVHKRLNVLKNIRWCKKKKEAGTLAECLKNEDSRFYGEGEYALMNIEIGTALSAMVTAVNNSKLGAKDSESWRNCKTFISTFASDCASWATMAGRGDGQEGWGSTMTRKRFNPNTGAYVQMPVTYKETGKDRYSRITPVWAYSIVGLRSSSVSDSSALASGQWAVLSGAQWSKVFKLHRYGPDARGDETTIGGVLGRVEREVANGKGIEKMYEICMSFFRVAATTPKEVSDYFADLAKKSVVPLEKKDLKQFPIPEKKRVDWFASNASKLKPVADTTWMSRQRVAGGTKGAPAAQGKETIEEAAQRAIDDYPNDFNIQVPADDIRDFASKIAGSYGFKEDRKGFAAKVLQLVGTSSQVSTQPQGIVKREK